MSAAKRFEDLEVWKVAFDLVRQIYSISGTSPFAGDFGLEDQIRRASASAMTNIAEGFSRKSTPDFIRFLDIARSSTAEVQSLLYIARSQEYVSQEQFDASYETCRVLRFKIGALIRYLRNYKPTT